MIINPGNYVGDGRFLIEGKGSSSKIECSLVIDTRDGDCEIKGNWQLYSREKKNCFTVRISKNSETQRRQASIELPDYALEGMLYSLDEIVNGVFTSEYRTVVIGVTLMKLENGLRVAGSILGDSNVNFEVSVFEGNPEAIKSNVVTLSKKA